VALTVTVETNSGLQFDTAVQSKSTPPAELTESGYAFSTIEMILSGYLIISRNRADVRMHIDSSMSATDKYIVRANAIGVALPVTSLLEIRYHQWCRFKSYSILSL